MVSEFSISPDVLLPLIGTVQAPRLIDVCIAEDIAAEPWRLPAAEHVSHGRIDDWVNINKPTEPVVVVCQKGLKLSHGAAARLRAKGLDAQALQGGNQAWIAAGFPILSLSKTPAFETPWVLPVPVNAQSLCLAWFIRRWINPLAELIWVPKDMVQDVADRFDAEPAPGTLNVLGQRLGLTYSPLTDFLASIDQNVSLCLPLLAAVSAAWPSPDAQITQAFPIIDAAWLASQGDVI